jgi:hypothetical protein
VCVCVCVCVCVSVCVCVCVRARVCVCVLGWGAAAHAQIQAWRSMHRCVEPSRLTSRRKMPACMTTIFRELLACLLVPRKLRRTHQLVDFKVRCYVLPTTKPLHPLRFVRTISRGIEGNWQGEFSFNCRLCLLFAHTVATSIVSGISLYRFSGWNGMSGKVRESASDLLGNHSVVAFVGAVG